jgi:hypothetical protein
MAVSLEDVKRQKDALLKKHPELKDLHVVPLCDSGLSYQELSDFIENCWRYNYGDQVRMSFCPEFLEFIVGPLKSDCFSATSLHGDNLVGLVLVLPNKFVYQDQKFECLS